MSKTFKHRVIMKDYFSSVLNFCKEYPFFALAFFFSGYIIGVGYFLVDSSTRSSGLGNDENLSVLS